MKQTRVPRSLPQTLVVNCGLQVGGGRLAACAAQLFCAALPLLPAPPCLLAERSAPPAPALMLPLTPPPLLPPTPAVARRADSQAVQITLSRAADDGAGERDVVRYVLWRQAVGSTTWGEPINTVAATQAVSYVLRDQGFPTRPGTYRYALAVQDCTPNVSGLAISAPVSVP